MKKSKREDYFQCDFCGRLEDKMCENICSGCGKLICLDCRNGRTITFTPFNLCELQDTPDVVCAKCEQNLQEFKQIATQIEVEAEQKLKQLHYQWCEKCNYEGISGENKVENSIYIYTVQASEVARKTYRIQANTEDEALQIASRLWGQDKDKNKDVKRDPSEIKITNKNSSFNQSDLDYVDNK